MRMFRVRRGVWVVLVVALLIAVAVPTADLWRAWSTPVFASVQLVPAHPAVGQTAHLVVTFTDEAQRLTHQAPLQITMDMAGMLMQLPPTAVTSVGSEYHTTVQFTMMGTWWLDLRLKPAAHAPWTQRMTVVVGAGSGG